MSEKECVHEFLTPMPDGYSYCHKCKASNRLTASHSPLPWEVESGGFRMPVIFIKGDDGENFIATGVEEQDGQQVKADFLFIVKCVNNHARLVEALESTLKDAQAAIDTLDGQEALVRCADIRGRLGEVLAALKDAGGKE